MRDIDMSTKNYGKGTLFQVEKAGKVLRAEHIVLEAVHWLVECYLHFFLSSSLGQTLAKSLAAVTFLYFLLQLCNYCIGQVNVHILPIQFYNNNQSQELAKVEVEDWQEHRQDQEDFVQMIARLVPEYKSIEREKIDNKVHS